jgi:hypothetical protein
MSSLCGDYMHRGQERTNVKTTYEFGIDPMKMMQFKNKAKMKVDH